MSKDSDPPYIYFATQNLHKTNEVRDLLRGLYIVRNLNDLRLDEEIPETGKNLEENSRLKAWYLFDRFGLNCFADDTGLEVEALQGAPGVKSARYAGEPKDDKNNVDLLLYNLKGKKDRKARFRTVITLIFNGVEKQFEGIANGNIITERRGDFGFGYDPVFQPDNSQKTFAEMSALEKNRISHRGKAIRKLVDYLKYISDDH